MQASRQEIWPRVVSGRCRNSEPDTPRQPAAGTRTEFSSESCSLRCRAPRMGALGDLVRKRFAVSPNRAILKIFFLPDGHSAFESIDQPATSVERRGTMGGRDHNENADFTDLKVSQAVNDGRIANVKLRERLRCQRLHLPERHFFVSLVFEIQSAPTPTVVSHYALEDHGCSVVGTFDLREHSGSVDRLADDFRARRTAADGWKQGDFISGMKLRVRPRVFLVHGDGNRTEHSFQ